MRKKGFTLTEFLSVSAVVLYFGAFIYFVIIRSSQEEQHDAKWRTLKAQVKREAEAESTILERLRQANAAGESTVVTVNTGGGRFAMDRADKAAIRRQFEKDHPDRVVTDMKVGRYGIWWVKTQPAGKSLPAEAESTTPSH